MHVLRARLLAEPDRDQLGEPALDRPVEARVRLDPVDAQHRVRAGGVAIEAAGDAVHGRAPYSTVSMVARTGAPTVASVTPRCASMPAWPSAVAPPWLPIAGTMNGAKSRCLRWRTAAATTFGMWAMPRLPTATATLAPLRRSASCCERASASSTAAAMSATASRVG